MTDSEPIRHFEATTGVEVIVHGDESRFRLACRVIESREAALAQAIRVLDSFMRDRREFELISVEVLADKAEDGCDFSLLHTFVADPDKNQYGYTYFKVYFGDHGVPGIPFWVHKFTIGFW